MYGIYTGQDPPAQTVCGATVTCIVLHHSYHQDPPNTEGQQLQQVCHRHRRLTKSQMLLLIRRLVHTNNSIYRLLVHNIHFV